MNARTLLFTGLPGCGKSTLIEEMLAHLDYPGTGFFTRELRQRGRRVGFSIITLDGKSGILAHKDLESPHRVGRYGVNLEDIDGVAVPSMIPSRHEEVVAVDEIGKMECLSPLFRATLQELLDSGRPLIGSAPLKGNQFIEEIKKRKDILLIRVTEKNREALARWVRTSPFPRGGTPHR
jgi:nucleoside-triphosphatase